MTGKRELLLLCHRIPYPPDKGDKIRSWRLLCFLAERFRVHLAAFVDDPRDFAHRGLLEGVCESVRLVPLRPAAAWFRSLRGFASGEPLGFAYYRDARLRDHVEALRGRDLAAEFAFSSTMAPYLAGERGRPRLVDFCDADAEKWRAYAGEARGAMRAVYAREARLLAEAETRILNWADAAFAVSREEAAIFNSRPGAQRRCDWFGNGVDTDYFRPSAERRGGADAGDVVFAGAMDYRANVDAALWFLREVWPKVRARAPEARFDIVGARPASSLRRWNGREGVRVTGRVEDIRPHLQNAKVAIAPLRIARGVQNKVLEAMAMARPVVASPEAAEGIEARDGEEFVVASNPDAFAAATLLFINDAKRGDALGASARARMKHAYSWPSRLARLEASLARLGLAQ